MVDKEASVLRWRGLDGGAGEACACSMEADAGERYGHELLQSQVHGCGSRRSFDIGMVRCVLRSVGCSLSIVTHFSQFQLPQIRLACLLS